MSKIEKLLRDVNKKATFRNFSKYMKKLPVINMETKLERKVLHFTH